MAKGITEKEMSEDHQGGKVESVDVLHDGVLVNPDLMDDAVDGENVEHAMTVWEAIKGHPWACLWAFIMCFTIVSWPSPDPELRVPAVARKDND